MAPSLACAEDTKGTSESPGDVGDAGEVESDTSSPGEEIRDALVDVERGPSPRAVRHIEPRGPSEEPPAVFVGLHACGGSSMSISTTVRDELAARGVPVRTVAPDSAVADAGGNDDGEGDDGAKCWTLDPDAYDLAFVEAQLEDTAATSCVDEGRVLFGGGSSGGFAAQAFGCRLHATAIASDRGGIHHPPGLFNFPPTPPPPPDACGPIPTLLGFARQDEVIDFETYAPESIAFWETNNGCSGETEPDDDTTAVVCDDDLAQCICERRVGCEAELVVCTWDGGHEAFGITDGVMAWWFERVLSERSALIGCENPENGG